MERGRFARSIRDRDWPGVIIEIAIVVVGVYLGLQASNWNQDRLDRARGREHLRRMAGDLQVESVLLQKTIQFDKVVGEYGAGAIGYAETGALYRDSPWQTLLAYYQASQIWPYRQPSTTFQEIQSSGEFELIANARLRANIARHYGDSAVSQTSEVIGVVPEYRARVRGLTPWALQQYIWSHCYRGNDADLGQVLVDCPSPISDREATAILEQFRQDAELTSDLRFWMVSLGTSQVLLGLVRNEAAQLSRDVDAELASR